MSSHNEQIKVGFFDGKFKNTVRDYYTYGFKKYTEVQDTDETGRACPSVSTIKNDWARIHNILVDSFKWSSEKDPFFMSADSQSMSENPFHRIYRFCRYNDNDPKIFFNIIFALSNSKAKLCGGADALGFDLSSRNGSNWDFYEHLTADLENENPLTSQELNKFLPQKGIKGFTGDDLNGLNKRLKELERIGFITDTTNKNENHRWKLTENFLDRILEGGKKIDDDFEIHFSNALDFFSKYQMLGEIGGIILSRFCIDHESIFRFKHEYFMHALNDYNLIDLLFAIENNYWCEIKYRHALTREQTDILCYPLEIRISTVNGREYVSYYEPFSRSYSNLRIEFIDSIVYFRDGSVIAPDGRKITIQDEQICSDLDRVRASLKKSWGVSTTIKQEGNAKEEAPLYHVKMKIAYDPEKEYYIKRRIERERRNGSVAAGDGYIEFQTKVTDDREMRPWIRSFYCRLMSCSGIEENGFSVEGDLNEIRHPENTADLRKPKQITKNDRYPEEWGIPKGVKKSKEIPFKAHQALFNEYFGLDYFVIADVLMELYQSEKECFDEDEVDQVNRKIRGMYKEHMGAYSSRSLSKEITELIDSDVFFTKSDRGYQKKYKTEKNSFYSSILPLSALECRWLRTIVNDSKMSLFFSVEELDYLKNVFSENVKELPFDKICYIDRFYQNETTDKKESEKEAGIIKKLIYAIQNHKKLRIQYSPDRGEKKVGEYIPTIIEFSKRDNLFRGYFMYTKDREIYTMNLSRIDEMEILEEKEEFVRDEIMKQWDEFREKGLKSFTVEFQDQKNTADRILNEFSSWRKECRYDRETKTYQLKIKYHYTDMLELVIRLLGYGGTIKILEQDSDIFKEYIKRIDQQYEIIKEGAEQDGTKKI